MESERERRLGQRHVLGPVAVRWRIDDAPVFDDGDALDGVRAGSRPEPAGLLDLSASGARILARDCTDLAVGDTTTIQIRDASGPVIVRRITSSSMPGFSTYGLEFANPFSPLPQLIHQELAQRRGRPVPGPGSAPPS